VNPPVPGEADRALAAARECLGTALVAAYLHGSAASDGLKPDSDVDVLLVTDRSLDDAERRRLLAALMAISAPPKSGDPRRPIELIVFTRADLENRSSPARSDFVYGEWLRDAFNKGAVPQPEADPELTILLAQVRQAAAPLFGPPPQDLLPPIPDRELRTAIGDARKSLLANIAGDERNTLLTLARMWRTLETGEIVSKHVAAEWAVARLSGTARALMERARLGYLGLASDHWDDLEPEATALAQSLSDRLTPLLRG